VVALDVPENLLVYLVMTRIDKNSQIGSPLLRVQLGLVEVDAYTLFLLIQNVIVFIQHDYFSLLLVELVIVGPELQNTLNKDAHVDLAGLEERETVV